MPRMRSLSDPGGRAQGTVLLLVLGALAVVPGRSAAGVVSGGTAAPAVQLEAPASNPASPWLLDRLGLPSRFAIALDQPLGDPDGGRAVTLRLTPAGFLAPGPRASSDVPHRGARALLERVGIAVTLGGPTEADDSSKVSRPRGPTKHITTELKLGLVGDRVPGTEPAPGAATRSFALGLGLTADTYSTRYGRDLYVATLAAEARGPVPVIANLAYRRDEKFHGRRNQELKLGAGAAWRCFARSRRPLDATLSGALLLRNRRRADILEAGAGLFLPLGEGLRLGASVTCASHEDRYAEGRVRGAVSLAFAR